LWCRKRIINGVVVFDALRSSDVNNEDMLEFYRLTVWPKSIPRVVVNLQQLDYVTSAFLAALLVLQRRLGTAKGSLILCGASPLIRDILARTHLETLFEVVDSEGDAFNRLRTGC
jgi:anti-anti-sigma factor